MESGDVPFVAGTENGSDLSVEALLDERTSALTALRESEERWRLVIQTANDAYIGMDEAGRIIDWNHMAVTTFGWDRDEVIGRSLAETIIPPDLRAAHQAGLDRFLATGEGPVLFQRLDLPGLHRSGRTIDLEITIWPSREAERWRFNAFLRDVTDQRRVRAYVDLLQHVAVVANSDAPIEEVLASALRAICELTGWPVGHVYVVDEDDPELLVPSRIWQLADPAFEPFREGTDRTTFVSGHGLPGRVHATSQPVWIADVSADRGYPRARWLADLGARSAFAFPVRVGRQVVAVLEFLATTVGEPDEALLDVMDNVGIQLGRAVERHRAARELHRANEELRAANELMGRFLSTASHELRSPLTAITGFATLLDDRWEDGSDHEKREHVRSIERQASRLTRLVEDLLTLSRIEAGALRVRSEVLRVRDIVSEVVRDLDAKGVRIDIDGDICVRADPDHLVQIIVNLITNAHRYGAPPIDVSAERAGDHVEIRVRDRGPGVAPAVRGHLFARFAPTSSDVAGGTGLGLSIVDGLAEANGGAIAYEEAAPGATFVVRLPAA